MGSEKDEPPADAQIVPHWSTPSLLSQQPPTDPAELKAILDQRLITTHYAAIGAVAAEWAMFESLIDHWIWKIGEIDWGIGACLTAQMIGHSGKLNAFTSLVRHLTCSDKWDKRLEKMIGVTSKLSEQRNRAVHDVWNFEEPENPARFQVTAKKELVLRYIECPTKQVFNIQRDIRKHWEIFITLAQEIFDSLEPLRERHREHTPQ